jgi:hypothetical protein
MKGAKPTFTPMAIDQLLSKFVGEPMQNPQLF